MESRKDQSSVMRQQQQSQDKTQSATSKPSLPKQSLPLQQQQANLDKNQPYEPKLVRDPNTGDYYDQNQQSRSAVQQQYAANPAADHHQGEDKRKQGHKSTQQGSPQSKTQAK